MGSVENVLKNRVKILHRETSNSLNSIGIKIFEGKTANQQSRNLRDTMTLSREPAWFIIHRGMRLKWLALFMIQMGLILHFADATCPQRRSHISALCCMKV